MPECNGRRVLLLFKAKIRQVGGDGIVETELHLGLELDCEHSHEILGQTRANRKDSVKAHGPGLLHLLQV